MLFLMVKMINWSSLFVHRIDDCNESFFEGGTSNEESIDIFSTNEVTTVGVTDGSTIDDSGVQTNLSIDLGGEPFTDAFVDFLCLFWSSNFACSNSPYWFISNRDLIPVFNFQLI